MKKTILFLSALFFLLVTSDCILAKVAESKKIYVLCYHTFLGKPKIDTDFSLSELKDQVISLKSNGYKFVSLSEFSSGAYTGSKNVLIIVDDGNISAYKAYQSVFKPLNIRPVFAIYSNVIGNVSYAMTWDQLKVLLKDGCDISSHGFYHLYLTTSFFEKDPKGFEREILISKQVLEKKLDYSVKTFVYPFGVVSPIAQTKIREAGYTTAFSLKAKPITNMASENKWDMPRYMMTRPIANSLIKKMCE